MVLTEGYCCGPPAAPVPRALQKIQRPPVRCVVIGNSNLSIEAAHEVSFWLHQNGRPLQAAAS